MKKTLLKSIIFLSYFLALVIVYQNNVVVIFSHEGLIDDFRLDKFIFSSVLIFFIALIVKFEKTPASFFCVLVYLFIVIPSLVIYAGSNLPNYFIFVNILALFLIILTKALITKVRPPRLCLVSQKQLMHVISIIAPVPILVILYYSGFKYFNLDLRNVYEIRNAASESLPSVFNYINSIFSKVVLPFLIVLSLNSKSKLTLIYSFFISFLFFTFTANKSPLLYPFFVTVVYYLLGFKNPSENLIKLLIVVLIICFIDSQYFTLVNPDIGGWFSSLIARRSIFVPSLLNWFHIEFFSRNTFYYWSESRISLGLIDPPYSINSSHLIGEVYYKNIETSANTGWIGSGYANAGLLGVAVYSVLIGFVFSIIDSIAKIHGSRTTIAVFVVPIYILLTTSDLMTSLISHGLILCFIMTLILKPQNKTKNKLIL